MTPNEALNAAKQALDAALKQKTQNQELIRSLGPAIIDALKPVLQEVASNSKITKDELVKAISGIQINVPKADVPQAQVEVKIPDIKVPQPIVNVSTPEVRVPDIKIPAIKVPKPEVTVNVPPFPKIPDLKWPEEEMPIKGWVSLMGVDLQNPLPVQLRDAKGNPLNLFENLTQIVGGGGGVAAKIVKVSGIINTVGVVTINPDGSPTYSVAAGSANSVYLTNGDNLYYNSDNPLPVSGTFTGGGDGVIMDAPNSTRVSVRALTNSNALVTEIVDGNGNQITSFGGGTQYADGAIDTTPTGTLAMGYTGDDGANVFALASGSGAINSGVLRIVQATDSVSSVSVTNLFQAVGDTGGGEGVSNALRVVQASGAVLSAYVNNPVAQGDAATALRVVIAGNSDVSVTATQTGTWNIGTVTAVTGITNSVAASVVDSSGVQYSGSNPVPVTWVSGAGATVGAANIDSSGVQYSGSNPLPIYVAGGSSASSAASIIDSTGVAFEGANPFPITIVTSATASVNASIVDSGGVGYSGSNPVPITIVSGALTSTIAVGDTLHDAADIGAAPLKVGGVAMQTNPTAVADGDRVNARFDDIGRPITRPIQARDLIATARVNVVNGTETTLIAAVSGVFLDCISVMCANASSNAVTADFRSVSTNGGVDFSITVPANATNGIAFPVPYPQMETNSRWTVDLSDDTHNITFNALFTKEV